MTVVPRERMRTRQFALALDGASSDPSLTQMTRVAGALNNAGGATAGPSDDFRATLRQRLVAVGSVAPVRPIGGMPPPAPWRRRLVAAGVALAISTGGAAATAVASTGALPGDRLYEVKRAVEIVQLALAPSELAKAERYLAIASARMSEVQGLLKAGGAADLLLVDELRRTLSDMSDAVAAGSARYFEVYNRTLDASVLAPLEEFLGARAAGLAAVRELLPVELLEKQGSMLVELESIARRVATATGRPQVTGVTDAPSAMALVNSRHLTAASRGQTERDLGAAKLPLERVRAIGSALGSIVGDAVAKLPSSSPSSATASKPTKSEVAGSVHTLMAPTSEADADASDGMTLALTKDKAPSARAHVGIVREIRATADTASSRLLGALPLPSETDDAVPGSLSTGLDIGLTRVVAEIIPLHKN